MEYMASHLGHYSGCGASPGWTDGCAALSALLGLALLVIGARLMAGMKDL